MPVNAAALGIFLVLLPGFTAAYLVRLLAARKKQSELDKVVEALIFSLLLYLITLPFFNYSLPIKWEFIDKANPSNYQITVVWQHLFALAFLAIILGAIYAAAINRNWLIAPFRWLKISERSARSSVWNDVFPDIKGFVQVGFSDGRSIIGWVRKWSDDEVQELFLEEAAWIDDEGNELPIYGPGILLTKSMGIEYVMFLSPDEQTVSDLKAS